MTKPIMAAILSCKETKLSDEEKEFFARSNPLGINIFARNIASKCQLQELIKEIKETIGREDVLIAVDQEGGRVRRLIEPDFRSYASAATLGSLPQPQAEKAARLHASLICDDLQETGINVNYAPVLDITCPDTSPVLKSRCFGNNPSITAALGKIMVDEYINRGISPCIKHMPGHGRASVDPHLNLPVINAALHELEKDFYPFRQLNYSPMGMTAHIIVSAIDECLPVTQSAQSIQTLIRDIIGFDGFLVSDAIDMKALKGTAGEKARASITAGCDCVCYAFGELDEMKDIAANCPPLNDKSLERFAKVRAVISRPAAAKEDTVARAEEYAQIIGSVAAYQETYDATEVLNRMRSNKQH